MNKFLLLAFGLGLAQPLVAALQTDIEYGRAAGESLQLDANIPEGTGPFAAVILVHGGGWTAGDKSGGPGKGYMAPMHEPLSAAGFAWFSVNYRLAPKHHYPACVDDVEAAIRWVFAHAKEYRIDPRRIALASESAGSHVAVMAALRLDASVRLAALVPFYGRYDLTADLKPGGELNANQAALFGRTLFDEETRSILRAASPIHYVKPGLPPFLLVHGTVDPKVPYEQSVMLQTKLREAKVPCDLLTIKGGGHGMLGWPAVAPTFKQDVVAWLQRTLAKDATAPATQ